MSFVSVSVTDCGRTTDEDHYTQYNFSPTEPDRLFLIMTKKRPDVSQWQKIDFYIHDHQPFTSTMSNEQEWKQELRRVQILLENHQKRNGKDICRCGIHLTMRCGKEGAHAVKHAVKKTPHAQTLKVRVDDGKTHVVVNVYKNGDLTAYKSFKDNFNFQRASPDDLCNYIFNSTPDVLLDEWRDVFFSVTDGRPETEQAKKIRHTGYLKNRQAYRTAIHDMQEYLKDKRVRSCQVSLFIETKETHNKNTAHASAARHTLSNHATMQAELQTLLEQLRAASS